MSQRLLRDEQAILKFAEEARKSGLDRMEMALYEVRTLINRLSEERQKNQQDWLSIESAPRDGTAVLVYRKDAGVFMASYTAPCEFLPEREYEKLGEDAYKEDWFAFELFSGLRLDGDLVPTHWLSLPKGPDAEIAKKKG